MFKLQCSKHFHTEYVHVSELGLASLGGLLLVYVDTLTSNIASFKIFF